MIKRRFESIIWLAYSLLSFAWLWLHEAWRDEAQAWLIVRDLNLAGMLKQMAIEGSPALWQLLIFPFAKLGIPYISMFILHWLIVVAAAWLFLFKSPFAKVFKFVFLFSFLMIFEYVLIARNYNLSILLLFAMAAIYHNRFEKPIGFAVLIILLFNTNIHSFAAAAVLTLIFFLEMIKSKDFNLKNWLALLIMLLGGVLVYLQMPPGSSLQQHAVISVSSFNFNAAFLAIGSSFLPGFQLNVFAGIIFSFVLLLFFIRFLEKPKIFLFLLVSLGWLLFIFGSVRTGDLRHHGLILIFLIFSLWLEKFYPAEPIILSKRKLKLEIFSQLSSNILLICLFLSIYPSFKAYQNDLKFSYSGSKEAAGFIRKNIEPDQLIMVHQSFACSSILPYLPEYKFWYADRQEFGTFIIWDKNFTDNAYSLSNEEVMARAERNFAVNPDQVKPLSVSPYEGEEKGKQIFYLLNSPIQNPEPYNLELIFQNEKKIFAQKDETFYIYKEITE